jgi:hypothetical protein
MAYSVSELWSNRSSETSYNGMTAARYFSVTGTVTEMSKDRNVESAPGIPRVGQSHTKDKSLKVASVNAGGGLVERIVTVSYAWFPNGQPSTGGSPSPLSQAPKISWSRIMRSVSKTHDITGNPIVNSAGYFFEPAYQADVTSYLIEITRYEPRFDFAKAIRFEGKVSNGAVVSGGVVFPAHCLKCISIMPAEEFSANSTTILMRYTLEARLPRSAKGKTSLLELQPFRHWVADVGVAVREGPLFYATGAALDEVGEPVNDPVPLKNGNPIETGFLLSDGSAPASKDYTPKTAIKVTINGVDWIGYEVDPIADLLDLRL